MTGWTKTEGWSSGRLVILSVCWCMISYGLKSGISFQKTISHHKLIVNKHHRGSEKSIAGPFFPISARISNSGDRLEPNGEVLKFSRWTSHRGLGFTVAWKCVIFYPFVGGVRWLCFKKDVTKGLILTFFTKLTLHTTSPLTITSLPSIRLLLCSTYLRAS